MMNSSRSELRDDAARATAIGALDRSLLVEAGAGSGKTAVMAGRVAMLLAEGAAPNAIAAVTFTELAAGELLQRVRAFVDTLSDGSVPAEMAVALPHGLNERQRAQLKQASAAIDQITCSTIHGFCQRLILPYPAEADIDPGAGIMDRDQADQAFSELVDKWMWAELDGAGDTLFAQLAAEDPARSVALVREILEQLRHHRCLTTPTAQPLQPLVDAFVGECTALAAFLAGAGANEADTNARSACFTQMAEEVQRAAQTPGHARLARLQMCSAHADLCTAKGDFKAFKTKGKWQTAAKEAGLKEQGERLFERAADLVQACQETWTRLRREVAAGVLAQLVAEARPMLEQFEQFKRNSGLLDFDDLIHSARALLRDHDDVRRALGARYCHVLVDEFQDTDPLQSEIFWRLCGDPTADGVIGEWRSFTIRAGALFLVGDPKQAIYRFRGADIAAYTAARDVFARRDDVLTIATNFRSCAPILDFVNTRFETCLSAAGQPGFTPLDSFHAAPPGQVCVAALDVAAAGADGTAPAEQQRDAEAEAVAEMCQRMIGNLALASRHGGEGRPCRAGDIALLAPTGSDLWRYEEALERRGIAVATQAGKGFYRRQEVQDLIAVCRVLADSRDTIALGALLRGPLVGLTEEQMLDIVWSLPRDEGQPEQVGKLTVHADAAHVDNELARDILSKLQSLRRQVNSTSPHLLLSQAIDLLRVRPILQQRHHGRAERALANVDKFLTMSQAYAVQGIAAFSAAMTLAWTDESRAPEGQPDAQEDAVTLYTMHSAKGLEWPVVVPINTMTRTKGAEGVFCERTQNRLCCTVFGTPLAGYESDREAESVEIERERYRLWYVAATRARELLVLPRLDVEPAGTAWIALLDLGLADLPVLELSEPAVVTGCLGKVENLQTREGFAQEAVAIASAAPRLRWRTPSRDEGTNVAVVIEETAESRIATVDAAEDDTTPAVIQGGRERGLVMHKLFEDVLTGEVGESQAALEDRAAELIGQIDQALSPARAPALSATEIAGCVVRALGLHDIAALRPTLVPEYGVYGSENGPDGEAVTVGIADAVSFSPDGKPAVVVDWKSDVDPLPGTITHYQAQVSNYMAVTGAKRGLIVLATSGRVIELNTDRGSSAG